MDCVFALLDLRPGPRSPPSFLCSPSPAPGPRGILRRAPPPRCSLPLDSKSKNYNLQKITNFFKDFFHLKSFKMKPFETISFHRCTTTNTTGSLPPSLPRGSNTGCEGSIKLRNDSGQPVIWDAKLGMKHGRCWLAGRRFCGFRFPLSFSVRFRKDMGKILKVFLPQNYGHWNHVIYSYTIPPLNYPNDIRRYPLPNLTSFI